VIPWTNGCTVEKEDVETEGAIEAAGKKIRLFGLLQQATLRRKRALECR
jgi:hypothetical protein